MSLNVDLTEFIPMVASVRTTFEGTQDEVVAEVIAWANLADLWEQIEDRCDPLDILDAKGCDYIVEDLDSEVPGQVDRYMTFLVMDDDVAKQSIRENMEAFLKPKRRTTAVGHLKLVKG